LTFLAVFFCSNLTKGNTGAGFVSLKKILKKY